VGRARILGAAAALFALTVIPMSAAHASGSGAGATETASAAAGSVYLQPLKAGAPKVVSNASAYAAASKSTGWMKTPGGLENTSCVHELPAGAKMVNNGAQSYFILKSGAHQALPQCAYAKIVQPQSSTSLAKNLAPGPSTAPPTGGWYYDTSWNSPTWLSELRTEYEVPAAPTESGATIFVFSSFQDAGLTAIVQPVLTYGPNGDYGGNYWYIAPWYVYEGGDVVGVDETVSQGDTIYGQMTATDCNSAGHCTWTIAIQDNSNTSVPASTAVVESATAYTSAQAGVLEIYNATGCAMLPHSDHAVYRDVYTYSGSGHTLNADPQWTVEPRDQQCSMYGSDTLDSTDFYWTGS
jgi:hypothetical protein